MRKAIRTLLIMTLLVAASATAQQETPAAEPSVSLPPELARVLTDYEAAWSKRDAAALAGLFAEDGFVLPGGRPPVRGRAAIQKHYTGQGGPLSLRAIAYAAEGGVGYIIGGYTDTAGKPDIGRSSRQGCDPAGESPAVSVARVGHEAIPQPEVGNHPGRCVV